MCYFSAQCSIVQNPTLFTSRRDPRRDQSCSILPLKTLMYCICLQFYFNLHTKYLPSNLHRLSKKGYFCFCKFLLFFPNGHVLSTWAAYFFRLPFLKMLKQSFREKLDRKLCLPTSSSCRETFPLLLLIIT